MLGSHRDDLVRSGLAPSLTGIHAYSAAKHALVGLTKQVSGELAPHGVTVNSIAPGLILSNPESPSGKFRFLINTFRRGAGA